MKAKNELSLAAPSILIASNATEELFATAPPHFLAGYSLVHQRDSNNALKFATQTSPDLIILNFSRPEICNLEFCQILRARLTNKLTPIIIVLEVSQAGERDDVFAAGANDYILKPFHPDEVKIRLGTYLTRKIPKPQLDQPHGAMEDRSVLECMARTPGLFYTSRRTSDGRTGLSFASPQITALFGLSLDDVRDDISPLLKHIHPEDLPKFLSDRESSTRNLSPLRAEFRVTTKDGEERWAELNSHPYPKDDGSIVWHGFIHDISDRKRSESDLALLSFAMDQIVSEAMYVIDAGFRIIEVNAAACRALGYSRSELLSMAIPDIDPDITESDIQSWSSVSVNNGTVTTERRHRAKDGHLFPVEIVSSIFRYHGRRLVVSLARDISERKRVEREYQTLSEAVSISSDMAFLINDQGRFLYVNDAACRTLEYTRADLLGMTALDIDPDITPEILSELSRSFFATGSGKALETRHRTRSGKIISVELSASLIALDNEKLCLAMARDITERKRTEDTLRFIAQQTYNVSNYSFHRALASYLASALEADHVIIARLTEDSTVAETRAFFSGGNITPNIHYPLDGTPCKYIKQSTICVYSNNVRELFPTDPLLAEMGAESYVGIPLRDSLGEALGLIAVIYVTPLHEQDRVISTLQLVAIRCAAELERERYEQQLSTQKKELLTLTENLPDNILRHDTDGRLIYANQSLEKTLGIAASRMLGKTIRELYPQGEYEEYVQALDKTLASGDPISIELTLPSPENSPVQIHHIRFIPEHNDEGRIAGALVIGHDISDRKHMELALAQSEHDYRSLAESSPDAIIRYDKRGRVRYLNSVLIQKLNLKSPKQLIGAHPDDIFLDGRFSTISRASEQVLKTATTISIELNYQNEIGEIRYDNVLIAPEYDENGQLIGTIAFGRDITHIREDERRLLHFVNSLPGFAYTCCVTTDGKVSFPYASSGIRELFGLEPHTVRHNAQLIDELTHPQDLQRLRAASAESARSMKPLHIELRICRPGIPERWINKRAIPEVQPDGSIFWYGMMLDITERKRYEIEQLEHLRFIEALEQVNRAMHDKGRREDVLRSVTKTLTSIFQCNRAFLIHPCDPESSFWTLEGEFTHAQYFDPLARSTALPMSSDLAKMQILLLNANGTLSFGECKNSSGSVPSCLSLPPLPQSMLSMALHLKTGAAWQLNLQHFSAPREWTPWEARLLKEIGRRIEDGLTSMLAHQDLLTKEEELRQSNKQLRKLSMHQEAAREEERKRIAREVHDELGQNLTALRMSISQLRFEFGEKHPELTEHISEMHRLALDSLKTVRNIASNLRPAVLDAGIGPALSWLISEFERRSGISCQLTLPEDEIFVEETVSMPLFRITQESLTNVIRHAHASEVNVSLRQEEGDYVSEISDNGTGFDISSVDQHSFGLMGMRERAEIAGGRLEILSIPGEGTTVRFRISASNKKEVA